MKFSVLIPVYDKELPEYLNEAVASILNQTIIPNEIVIVEDGILNEALQKVINNYVNQNKGLFKIIKIEKNCGLGIALNIGVNACSNELIARMDSDDISLPDRFETQLKCFEDNKLLDVLGGQIKEFSVLKENVKAKRKVPNTNNEIKKYIRKRNPINHMSVMFKKSAVINAGNYIPLANFEDYYLWIRMINLGYNFENTPNTLVLVRLNNFYNRRGGYGYLKSIISAQTLFYNKKYIKLVTMISNLFLRILVSIVPLPIRKFLYMEFLRNDKGEK